MSNLQAEGTIKKIFGAQKVSDSFTKQEFILTIEDGQYPQTVKFECTQSYCDQLQRFKEGMKVSVNFNLRGREWTNKENKTMYFNTLNAWKIESKEAVQETTNDSFNSELPF